MRRYHFKFTTGGELVRLALSKAIEEEGVRKERGAELVGQLVQAVSNFRVDLADGMVDMREDELFGVAGALRRVLDDKLFQMNDAERTALKETLEMITSAIEHFKTTGASESKSPALPRIA